jgi:hypothetical protein
MGPDPSDKSCKPPKFNVHQINASTSEIAQRQFCPHSSPWSRLQRMSQESPTCRLSVPQRKFGFEEITKLSLKSWLFADIGGEVTHCNAAFLKPPSVSRLVAWQIDPGYLTSFLEERGS